MTKILFTTALLLLIASCSKNSDDDNNNNEDKIIGYHFGVGSVLDSKNDEETKFEIEIDGEKFNGIAPYEFNKIKKSTLEKTHLKFKLSSSVRTNVTYELRSGGFGIDSKYISGGTFQDKLDTIITINKN